MVDAHKNDGIIDHTKGCRLEIMIDGAASGDGVGNSNALVVCDEGPSRSLEPDCRRGVRIKYGIHCSRAEQHTGGRTPMMTRRRCREWYGDSRLKVLLAPATNGPAASAASNTTLLALTVRVSDPRFALVADTSPEIAPK